MACASLVAVVLTVVTGDTGYGLDAAPTVARMVLGWRFDVVFGTVALVLAALYLLGVRRVRRRGRAWPVGRVVAWLAGCLTLLIATSSGIGAYAPAMFSVHLGSHLLLSVVAPALLVLGGPISLALRALPAAREAPSGPRGWLVALVRSPACRLLTHPAVAFVLLVGPFYLLYVGGMFGALVGYRWAHLAMHSVFLVAGYLFFWPVVGVDPAPRRLPPAGRVGVMFALVPCFGFLAVVLANTGTVIGESFYRSLDLPWGADLIADQRLGGSLVWALGEMPALVLLVATAVGWARSDDRDAVRADRRADATGEGDLAAYNAMLAEFGNRSRTPD